MKDPHLTLRENIPAYAIGALDAEDARILEEHLRSCDQCQTELAGYRDLSVGLLTALPPRPPRSNLRRTLQKQLNTASRSRRSRFVWSPFGRIAAGVALVLLLVLNAYSTYQVYSLKQGQAELSGHYDSEQTAIAMLAYPGTQSIGFDQNGVSGSLLVDKKRNLLAVFVWHLPTPPSGKAYQMWLVDPQGDRTSGGFLVPEADQPFVVAVIASQQPLSDFTGLGVTVEPKGGSLKPTGPKVLGIDF